MQLKAAIFASRFSIAGLYDETGQLILAEGYPGGYIAYCRHRLTSYKFDTYYPSPEIRNSEDWKPISPIED